MTMKLVGMAFLAAVVCAVCCFYVDAPVAWFARSRLDDHVWLLRGFQAMAAPSLLSLPFGLIYLSGLVIKAGQAAGPWRAQALLSRVSVAILVATAAKDLTKWMFGRPWPHSLIDYGLYRFRPFTDDPLYGAFPSGHTAYIAAPLLVVASARPEWRFVCYGVIAIVMIGLVGGGYHFPGDVLAGLLVGWLAARGTLALMPV